MLLFLVWTIFSSEKKEADGVVAIFIIQGPQGCGCLCIGPILPTLDGSMRDVNPHCLFKGYIGGTAFERTYPVFGVCNLSKVRVNLLEPGGVPRSDLPVLPHLGTSLKMSEKSFFVNCSLNVSFKVLTT